MYSLIIDTNVWIDLCRKYPKVLDQLSGLVLQGRIRLIVPVVILDEWNRHKQEKIVEAKKSSIGGMIKNARFISQFLDEPTKETFENILDKVRARTEEIERMAEKPVGIVETLFNHPSTIQLQILEEVRLRAVEYALAKKAPFQNKNSMADALTTYNLLRS